MRALTTCSTEPIPTRRNETNHKRRNFAAIRPCRSDCCGAACADVAYKDGSFADKSLLRVMSWTSQDEHRSERLRELGVYMIRVTNDDVLKDMDAVLQYINREAERLVTDRRALTPSPSPRGEGS